MADMSGEVPIRISDFYPEASAIIRKYESVNQSGKPHLTPYYDKLGNKWTVGFGRTLSKKQVENLSDDEIKKRYSITLDQAEDDLDNQVRSSINDVVKLKRMMPEGIEFSRGEIEALIPLIQNVGLTNVLKLKSGKPTKAITALKKGDKKEFARQLFDPEIGIVRAGDSPQKGLQIRRGEEGILYDKKASRGGRVERNPYNYEPRPI